jgi:drug/metabolite transporter (DMT)-like permease
VGLSERLGAAFGAQGADAERNKRLGYGAALGAAALAGLIPIFGKRYLTDLDPLVTAGFANLLAGLVILPLAPKPPFRGADRSRLVAIALVGAAAAPILYWQGLPATSGSEAAMLVNVETVFTMALAVAVLRERAGPVEVASVLAIVFGAVVLTTNLRASLDPAHLLGNLLIVAATALWAVDNNLSTGLSRRNSPQAVAAWKNVVGAGLVVAVAVVVGKDLAQVPSHFVGLLLAGGLGTGVSLTLFYLALRHIGAYRTSAVFGLGGVFGAAAAFFVLGERLSLVQVAGAAVMVAAAVALAVTHREAAQAAPSA